MKYLRHYTEDDGKGFSISMLGESLTIVASILGDSGKFFVHKFVNFLYTDNNSDMYFSIHGELGKICFWGKMTRNLDPPYPTGRSPTPFFPSIQSSDRENMCRPSKA